jgi:hypothetical protein
MRIKFVFNVKTYAITNRWSINQSRHCRRSPSPIPHSRYGSSKLSQEIASTRIGNQRFPASGFGSGAIPRRDDRRVTASELPMRLSERSARDVLALSLPEDYHRNERGLHG